MTIRTGISPVFVPPPSAQATSELINRAQAGELTQADAAQLSALLDSPEFQDAFSPAERASLKAFISGKEAPVRTPGELTSDLSKLQEARDVPERFTADLVFAHPELMEHAMFSRDEKATRLFQFLLPYVKATGELAQTPQELKQAAGQLVKEAEKAGVGALVREGDGKNGLEVLKDALKQPLQADQLQTVRFDAPVWPKDPPGAMEQRMSQEHERSLQVQQQKASLDPFRHNPALQQPVGIRQPADPKQAKDEEDEPGRHKGRGGQLSKRMLWNVLHTFRSDGEEERESAAQRDTLNSIIVAAALVLGFLGIVIGILVAL